MTPTEQDRELREKLAAIEHQRWADWQKWVHKVLREANPSPEIGDILERWDRLIETPYEKLSDREKASDMEQVDRYWRLITADRKRVESVPTEKKQHDSHNRLMALIGVLAAVVTISFMIWVNHLNHNENVQLEEQRITQKAH